MEAGSHRYPFTFTLPPTAPSSFESAARDPNVGYVRYTAEATMDRPWKFNHVTRSAFTVISIVDLNMEPPEFRVNLASCFLTYLLGDRALIVVQFPARDIILSRYVTSHPGQLSLAIPSWVGVVSTMQPVMPCGSKGGIVRVWVAGKTV